MKIHRFLYPHTLKGDLHTITDKVLVHQISRVLKLKNGEHIELFDGSGICTEVQIASLSKNEAVVTVIKTSAIKKPSKSVALFFSILKNIHTELAVEKAVEIGVSEIVPIISARTIKTGFKRPRIESIIKEATEQSGRAYLPHLHDTMNFESALDFAKNHFKRTVLFDPKGTLFQSGKETSVAVFIGPEGGFTDKEILTAQSKGIEVCSLPTHILRGETAAIISVYSALL